jgi:hypothetical protein
MTTGCEVLVHVERLMNRRMREVMGYSFAITQASIKVI